MFRKNESEEDNTFWISYADLMAGLLFVFILLIGMIISKSIILKSNLHDKEGRLEDTQKNLEDKLSKVDELKIEVEIKDKLAKGQDKTLSLQDEEIEKLNRLLLKANTERDNLNGKIIIVQNLLENSKDTIITRDRNIEDYENKIIILSNQITEQNSTLKFKDKKMLKIMNALDEKATKYDLIVENLQSQKAKIKSLTGIKIKVISELKKALGKNIAINPKNGSLRLSSNILFDKGSSELKLEAKSSVKEAFEKYIGELLTNQNIKSHLDRIIVEGHTDSDGTYLRNLELSQERAFEVMTYILSLEFSKKHNLKSLITATGRSYLDIIEVNGIEDKDASRRIDIKFRLKNQDAMKEIEKVLDAE
ncbi:MAG: OmpA family protein [Sulfurovum sp.]|nr:OmpA family protein [Sulfurovaceae bacterium]